MTVLPLCLRAAMCDRVPLTPHVHAHTHRLTNAHRCTHALQANGSNGSPGAAPVPPASLPTQPSALLPGRGVSASPASLCQHAPDKFLVGTLTNCRGPDPIWRRPPSRWPGDRAVNGAPGTERAPLTQGRQGGSPRERTESLVAAASVHVPWLRESG